MRARLSFKKIVDGIRTVTSETEKPLSFTE